MGGWVGIPSSPINTRKVNKIRRRWRTPPPAPTTHEHPRVERGCWHEVLIPKIKETLRKVNFIKTLSKPNDSHQVPKFSFLFCLGLNTLWSVKNEVAKVILVIFKLIFSVYRSPPPFRLRMTCTFRQILFHTSNLTNRITIVLNCLS